MNRRQMIQISAGAALGLFAIPKIFRGGALAAIARADDPVKASVPLVFAVDIGNNHGHALVLDLDSVVRLLRKARVDGQVVIDIRGTSGHTHALDLNVFQVSEILEVGELVVESTLGASHKHPVKITLSEPVLP